MGELKYEPTPAEIKEECEKIREDWTERDYWIRSGHLDGKPFLECPRVRLLAGRREL